MSKVIMKLYIGLKEKAKPAIFERKKEPSKETHTQYDIIYGPFKNKEDAEKYLKAMVCGGSLRGRLILLTI